MRRRTRTAELPSEIISLTTYAQLELYLAKFAAGELGLVLLLGRHGTGKTESVRRALRISPNADGPDGPPVAHVLHVEGHVQPYGLYRGLWDFRDRPVVLDDLDKLYAVGDCVRILKPLCNTDRVKRITWLTNLTQNSADVPISFTTKSSVILIANEWRSVNPNVRALEDRAIILHFQPSNAEIHRRVGEWFYDSEVYSFIGRALSATTNLSMRHYCKGSQLRRAGLEDWRSSLAQMMFPDRHLACVMALQHEPNLRAESERVARFVKLTGFSRSTYFRLKLRLAAAGALENSCFARKSDATGA